MTFRRDRYPRDWPAIRAGILMRANNRCERCSAPNGEVIARGEGPAEGTYMLERGEVFDAETGAYLGLARGSEYEAKSVVRVVLTVAHLDHVEANNDCGNLAALCQRCHFAHDRTDNAHRARESRRASKAAGTLPGME